MAEIKTNFNDVLKNYPDAVKEIEKKVRSGRSKHKNDALSSLNWAYGWCVKCQAYSINDILNGVASKNCEIQDNMSIKESIKDELSRSSAWVIAKKGRGHWQSGSIAPIPKEIKDLVKQNHQKRKEEDKRFANLSPAEKEKEMDKALKELSKQKGFFVVGVK